VPHPSTALLLRELPTSMQLHSLCLSGMNLQLGKHGVLATAPALTQLQLKNCRLLGDGAPSQLTAALSQLPRLQHLSLQVLRHVHSSRAQRKDLTLKFQEEISSSCRA
jgi:hypothetical protein